MHYLDELKKLLGAGGSRRTRGEVVSTSDSTVTVRVNGSTRVMQRNSATNYRPGDEVFVQGEVLLGKAVARGRGKSYPV